MLGWKIDGGSSFRPGYIEMFRSVRTISHLEFVVVHSKKENICDNIRELLSLIHI